MDLKKTYLYIMLKMYCDFYAVFHAKNNIRSYEENCKMSKSANVLCA